MEVKTEKRQLLTSRKLAITFAKKVRQKNLVKATRGGIAPALDLLMEKYIAGDFDHLIDEIRIHIVSVSNKDVLKANVTKDIKDRFGDLTWEQDLIDHPSKAVLVAEALMRMYNVGALDSVLNNKKKK